VTGRALQRASEELEAARGAFYHLVESQADFAAAQTRLITALPVFRAHMIDVRLLSDRATLDAMADEYRGQLDAHFCIVTDPGGRWIGSSGWPDGTEPTSALRSGIEEALTGEPQRQVVSIGDRLFLVVFEPARFAEETLGSLTVGYILDDTIAEQIAQITQAEVNLATAAGLSGSSLPETVRAQLGRSMLAGDGSRAGIVGVRWLGDVPYVTGVFSLFPDRASDGVGRLLLLQDWRPTQGFLDELRTRLLLTGTITFALAVIVGVMLSRRWSRPLKEIADAAGEITSGNWSRQVPVRGTAEATTMATAFNEMTANLRHWHQQAQDRAERLQASYERFHSVTESARDGIVSTNGEGAITFWNRSAGLIFGCAEDEALGTPLTGFIVESDRGTYREALTVASNESGPIVGRSIELTAVKKNGTRFPAELSLSAWRRADVTSVTVVVRDASERKGAEEVLRQREKELRHAQKMEAIGLLAGGVAHDFNNLLTVIQGYGELLRESLADDDARRDDVAEVLKASGRAAALTRQLLAFSRRQVLAPQVLALDQIVAGTEKMLRRLIGEDIELSSASEAPLGCVRADPGQIEQVLVNLVVNARDAMPDGGKLHIGLANVELEGAASRLQPGSYVRIDVSDTGCGMPPDVASRIFEPFFTTKGEGKGTGLGLATVYGIVQQSGGSVEVASETGRGTTFRIHLPRCADGQAAVVPAPPRRRSRRGSETVLLVEDDDHVRALVATMLRQNGYTVLDANGGDAALEIARGHEGRLDLLLTDVVMPGMNGRILAQHLGLLRPGLRVLFMSGYSDDAVLRAGVQMAEMAFLQKPLTMDALTGAVHDVLASPWPIERATR
jgi:PAS domain S-box-containing protein